MILNILLLWKLTLQYVLVPTALRYLESIRIDFTVEKSMTHILKIYNEFFKYF